MSDISHGRTDVTADFDMERTPHGTRIDPDVRPPAPLPRDVPRACRRMVQWLAACLHHLRNRIHRALHLSGELARLARMGASDRSRDLPWRQLLRIVDPSLRDAPSFPGQGISRHL